LEAIVLAGGLGTRLASVISDLPKPMAPVRGRPFLEYIFRYLGKNGIGRAILSVGYKWESINARFGDRFEGVELVYSVENEPLGTGGAIKRAMRLVLGDKVFIINGDTFFNVPLQKLEDEFAEEGKLMLALKKMRHFDRYGCVEVDDRGMVTAFTEKGYREAGNINGGIYLVRNDIFESFVTEEKFSFETFMEEHFKVLKIQALLLDSFFIDIGIPEDYAKAQIELSDRL